MATPLDYRTVRRFVDDLAGADLHVKQVDSIAHAVLGAIHADRTGVAALGRAAAREREVSAKHSIKQVDRLLSNSKVDVSRVMRRITRRVVGKREEIVVAIDWTEFAPDGHSTVAISLISKHGRATPLVWLTVESRRLKNNRSRYEDKVLWMLAAALPGKVRVTVLADRGFSDSGLYELLSNELHFDFVIRFKAGVIVEASDGEPQRAAELVPSNGHARRLLDVRITRRRRPVAAVVLVRRKDMKESWCLATSRRDEAKDIVELYRRRFDIEHGFRDQKDWRYGAGLYYARVGDPARRDRLILVMVIATLMATLLGAAGEKLGLDRKLRANTEQSRTHSLWRQGREYARGVARDISANLRRVAFKFWRALGTNREIYAVL